MFKVEIQPQWQLLAPDGQPVVQRLIDLLVGIRESGSLARACARGASGRTFCPPLPASGSA